MTISKMKTLIYYFLS